MKKILFIGVFAWMAAGLISSPAPVAAASPSYVVNTAPASNELAPVVVQSTAATSAVATSSSAVTRIDSAFNAIALAAIGAAYQRAEIQVQNTATTAEYCGYSPGVTTSTGFRIDPGAVWSFSLGKGIGIYCVHAAGSPGTLVVGGIAWKQ